ncbi:MAG: hypothetical protein IIY82_01095 [Firmicutes bacterium]|nr:hypothetical protein [Bacillota bacterium]
MGKDDIITESASDVGEVQVAPVEGPKDRIGRYLRKYAGNFLFDELAGHYLESVGMSDILSGIPVPIRKTDMTELTNLKIARNMACIVGCDLSFKYRENYLEYIRRSFGKGFVKPLIAEGVDAAERRDMEYACICFRAATLIDPDDADAYYCYGRACKDLADAVENADEETRAKMENAENYIGRFKMESLEAFEKAVLRSKTHDRARYYLGYAYLNLGLYIKADLVWKDFLDLARDAEDEELQKMVSEVREWRMKLEEPIHIENGYNLVLRGRFLEGIEVLQPYTEDKIYAEWWPLWYYLGTAYKGMHYFNKAEKAFLEVLRRSPSNDEVMRELVDIYEQTGEDEKAEKYRKKIQIVEENREAEKAERNPGLS